MIMPEMFGYSTLNVLLIDAVSREQLAGGYTNSCNTWAADFTTYCILYFSDNVFILFLIVISVTKCLLVKYILFPLT